jgi:hypothetical protein
MGMAKFPSEGWEFGKETYNKLTEIEKGAVDLEASIETHKIAYANHYAQYNRGRGAYGIKNDADLRTYELDQKDHSAGRMSEDEGYKKQLMDQYEAGGYFRQKYKKFYQGSRSAEIFGEKPRMVFKRERRS